MRCEAFRTDRIRRPALYERGELVDASGIEVGPAFRAVDRHGRMRTTRLNDRAVADMIKRRAAAVGLDGLFAGHSLRSGFATEGYAQGTPELAIMRHGRWKSATSCGATSRRAVSGATTPLRGSGCNVVMAEPRRLLTAPFVIAQNRVVDQTTPESKLPARLSAGRRSRLRSVVVAGREVTLD